VRRNTGERRRDSSEESYRTNPRDEREAKRMANGIWAIVRKLGRGIGTISLLGTLACTGWPGLPGSLARNQQIKEGMVRTTLQNGLKLILVEDHSAPVVSLNVWVRVGSADEQPAEAGMAHVFEHMLFKGTERRAVGEIARTVEAAGGDINAYTSFDQTVYHITMASRDVATGVDVLADAVQNSTFDPDELAKETEVVVEEIRRGLDSPERVLSQALFSAAYREHPYRLPVIGTAESVRSFTRPQLLDFLRRWYVPNNMTFVAVGDFEPGEMRRRIETAFAGAAPNRNLDHARAAEPDPIAPRAVVERARFEQTLLGMGYLITGISDTDTAYVDLLSSVLGGGDSSRLYREVKDRQELVYSISAASYTPLDRGLFFVDAELEPDRVEEAVAAIGREIERLATFGPSIAELERARVNFLASTVHERETMEGQARKLGYWEVIGDGVESEAEYLERIRNATPDDLRRVAARYLRPERATLSVLLPEAERPELTAESLTGALVNASGIAEIPKAEQLGDGILRYVLPNGLRVIVRRNTAVELVSMRIAMLGGQLAESEDSQGITSFLAEALERGTERRSAAEFATEVEGIAGSISGFSGRNSFGISADFLSDTLDTGLDLFSDMLLRPRFDPGEIDQVRAETLNALKRREDSLSQQAFELFAQAVYEEHPYRLRTLGTEETVKSFDSESLRRYYDTYVDPRNAVLSIVGDVEPDALIRSLTTYLGAWEPKGASTLPARVSPGIPDERREVAIEKGNTQQVHVVVGFPGISVSDPDGPALDVLTQVLSGQAGRLFLELRDRRSLAYTTAAFTIEGVDPGSWGVYIASAPEKLEESLSGLEAELQRLLQDPIEEAELARARNYLIGSQAVSLQRYSVQASLLALDELYGLGARHYLDYANQISAVTGDDVQRVARRIIQTETPVVAIVK